MNLFNTKWEAGQVVELPIRDKVPIHFVWCPAGDFVMGNSQVTDTWQSIQKPAHHVVLTKGFWIAQTLTTERQWLSLVQDSLPCVVSGSQDLPVEIQKWKDAKRFCERLTMILHEQGSLPSDHLIDLPTEAQWEYACRAGTTSIWYFGENEDELSEHSWYAVNSQRKAHPVKQKRANPWGIYDLYGNLSEWCQDDLYKYKETETASPDVDPVYIVEPSDFKITRGGGFLSIAQECQSASRVSLEILNSYAEPTGLRIVCKSE